MSTKTICKHVDNIDFYLNEYLNYHYLKPMEDGIYEVNSFLGNYFIRKCMWASKTSIKENASSIKKFYYCMMECGLVSDCDYDKVCFVIKSEMDNWLEELEEFDSFDMFDDDDECGYDYDLF